MFCLFLAIFIAYFINGNADFFLEEKNCKVLVITFIIFKYYYRLKLKLTIYVQ